jgi:hypothetical protein
MRAGRRRLRRLLPLAAATLLAGCSSIAPIVGVVSGAVAGGATANPAVGFAVGVAAAAASDIAVKHIGRTRQQTEQDAIAAIAGDLAVGATVEWRVRRDIPIGNEHGRLMVVRLIDSPLAPCKEIVFSVQDGPPESPAPTYSATICHQHDAWKWATAEPATERWGNLQ